MKPISALFYRQQHARFSAQTTVNFKPKSDNDLAGLTCYQSERFNYVFGITKEGKKDILLLARTERGKTTIIAKTEVDVKQPITLYVDGMDNDYKFNYSVGGEVMNLGGTVSGDILSTNRAGGFTGAMIGLYTTKGNTIK